MFEQIDHRGKRFTINDDDIDDDAPVEYCRRANTLECRAERENRILEHAKVVAGPAGANPDVEVLDRFPRTRSASSESK